MAKKKEITVEDKLRSLYNLQLIDSQIDKIRDIRGELPLEVRDLEDEIEGLKNRIKKLEQGLEEINEKISIKKNLIAEAKVLIKKYTEQQKNVRNNREFDSLTWFFFFYKLRNFCYVFLTLRLNSPTKFNFGIIQIYFVTII